MKYMRDLLRPVEGYTPGEQPKDAGVIKLNTNENPYPPSPRVLEALGALGMEALRKYPDPVSTRFRGLIAQQFNFPGPEWVIVGNGMDELLALVLRAFVDPGDTVLAQYPTYTLYEVLCKLHGAQLRYVELDNDFQLTPQFFSTPARLCFLTRPNAPTGIAASMDEVRRFCGSFEGIVVIDEAYVDFCSDHCAELPKDFENVIVMRTFSKSFSLAGARIGYAIARPELIAEFLKVKDSYNLSAFAQAAGCAAFEDYDYMLVHAARIRTTREALRSALTELGFCVPASQSNFLLAQWNGSPSTPEIFEQLTRRRILVRYFKAPRLENALRITVGTEEECAALLNALKEIVEAPSPR